VEAALGEARGFERRFFIIAEGSRYAAVQDVEAFVLGHEAIVTCV
jgi:hypothetical protein